MGVLQDLAKYPGSLYLVIFLSAIGGFLFGYDTGVIAGALPLVEQEQGFFPDDASRLDVDSECGVFSFCLSLDGLHNELPHVLLHNSVLSR